MTKPTSSMIKYSCPFSFFFFFFNDTATTEIYTLSLHDALPIRPRRDAGPPDRAHPAGPPARLPDGPRASRGRRGRGHRRVLAGAPRRPDRTAVPERRQR